MTRYILIVPLYATLFAASANAAAPRWPADAKACGSFSLTAADAVGGGMKRADVEALLGPPDQEHCEEALEQGPFCELTWSSGLRVMTDDLGPRAHVETIQSPQVERCVPDADSGFGEGAPALCDGSVCCPIFASQAARIEVLDGDAPTLAPPKGSRSAELTGVRRIGDRLLAGWTDCAGPCGRGQLYDAAGKALGKPFDFGDDNASVALVGSDAIAVTGNGVDLVVLSRATGKVLAKKDLAKGDPTSSAVVWLGGDRLAVAWRTSEMELRVAWLTFDGRRLTTRAVSTLPVCR